MGGDVISSRANARVKQLRAAFAGQARLSGGMVAIEGEHLLEEALRSGMVLKTVFVSERREVPKIVPRGVEVLRLTEEVFGQCGGDAVAAGGGGADGASGVGAGGCDGRGRLPLILIAVGLQDPGNLGTLVRSAEAFGATGVLTTPGTVSAWNQKALRASVGSVFRVPVVAVDAAEVGGLKRRGVRLLAAVGAGERGVTAAQEVDFGGGVCADDRE